MLIACRSGIACKCRFVTYAGNSAKDHRERASVPGRGQIGIGSVDRRAVMSNRIARLQTDGDFASEIVVREIDDAL